MLRREDVTDDSSVGLRDIVILFNNFPNPECFSSAAQWVS